MLQFPSVGSAVARKAGSNYEKRVKDGMAGAEKILKVGWVKEQG